VAVHKTAGQVTGDTTDDNRIQETHDYS
jgi:hypothetical protein